MPFRRAATGLSAAVVVLTTGLLSGCSTGSPTSPATSTDASSATSTSTATATAEATSTLATVTVGATTSATSTDPAATATADPPAATVAPPAPTTPAVLPLAGPLPTEFTALTQTIKDDALGHEIVLLRMARNLPWPTRSTGQSAAFELLAVEMRWTPGTKYTAPLREIDFSLITGSQYPNRPDPIIDAQLAAAVWGLLPPEVQAGESVTGWVVFLVDPKAATSIRLDYTRPEIAVAGSRTRFAKKVFSAQIVG